MFKGVELEACLRRAAAALNQAEAMVASAEDGAIAYPGKAYLLGKLHCALAIIELELPEFRRAAEVIAVDAIAGAFDAENGTEWRSVFHNGATKL